MSESRLLEPSPEVTRCYRPDEAGQAKLKASCQDKSQSLVVDSPQAEEPPNETRFFYVDAALLNYEVVEKLTRDELLLFLLHCRYYNPNDRVSGVGERAARKRLYMRKSAWQRAGQGLQEKGFTRTMPNQNYRRPRTAIGSPNDPWGSDQVPSEDKPSEWDRHLYRLVSHMELVKMPWSLVDGAHGTQPVLANLRTRTQVLVLMGLYLVAGDDGMIPPVYACAGANLTLTHALGPILPGLDQKSIQLALAEVFESGLIYPACEDFRGGQVLWLFHPLEPAKTTASEIHCEAQQCPDGGEGQLP